MAGVTASQRAAGRLMREKEELAMAVTRATFAAHPELLERYGDKGWHHCLEDMRFNIEFLVPAVDLQRPEMYAGYATWLTAMLGSRGVPASDVSAALTRLDAALRERLAADEMAAVAPSIAAALAAVAGEGAAR